MGDEKAKLSSKTGGSRYFLHFQAGAGMVPQKLGLPS